MTTRQRSAVTSLARALGVWCCVVTLSPVVAQSNLPPELSGDYSVLPPPRPPAAPTPTPAPRTPASAATPPAATTPTQRAPAPTPRELPPELLDPEAGDVGPPVAPELAEPDAPPDNSDQDVDDGVQIDDAAPIDGEASAATTGVTLQVGVGVGVGTLSFTRPTRGDTQHLPQTPFAATDIVVQLNAPLSETFSLDVQLLYQASLGLVLEVQPLFALPQRVDAHVRRVEMSMAPVWKLGAISVAIPTGIAIRAFVPEQQQYGVRPYTFAGLTVRPELIVPLSDRVSVRGGPEVQWLPIMNSATRNTGVEGMAGAWGAQAALHAGLSETIMLALVVRQLRTYAPFTARFTDQERFFTLRLMGTL